MSEKTNTKPNKKPNYILRRMGAVAGAAALTAAGVGGFDSFAGNKKKDSGPEKVKVYVVKAGDTAWSIHDKAGLSGDPREFSYNLDQTLPNDASHEGGLLQPSDEIYLPDSSEIGQEIETPSPVETPSFVPPKGGAQGDYPPPVPQG